MGEIKITILSCRYTGEITKEDLARFPGRIKLKTYPCSGRIEIVDILEALEEGSQAVIVAGCKEGTCHNLEGSTRAHQRVLEAKKILKEINFDPERVKMIFVPRLEAGHIIEACERTYEELLEILKNK